ncbi:MAG: hypothetical protein F6K65_33455 [Moorea sp. SIO3C2]|nr:hypothetical protein [Moorena sp. SIO3C2]
MSDCIKTGAGSREQLRGKREELKNAVYLIVMKNPDSLPLKADSTSSSVAYGQRLQN